MADEQKSKSNGDSAGLKGLLRKRRRQNGRDGTNENGMPPSKRWKFNDQPITEWKDVPPQWNADDCDIDANDVDAVIARCKERIQDGIMPQWWTKKLAVYESYKAKEMVVLATESSSLPRETILRIKTLVLIEKHIKAKGDPFKQMVNVKAIMESYRAGRLLLTPGYVSYWSNGKQISDGLLEFDWKDVDKYNKKFRGKSFWVEGLSRMRHRYPYDPGLGFRKTIAPVNYPHSIMHEMELVLKVPLGRSEERIKEIFLDDTGSDMPNIYFDDLERMVDKSGFKPPFLCYESVSTGNGVIYTPTCKLFFSLEMSDGRIARPWVPLQTGVSEDPYTPGDCRTSGDWLRRFFYAASAPNNLGELLISETAAGLSAEVPDFDVEGSEGAPMVLPPLGHSLYGYLTSAELDALFSR